MIFYTSDLHFGNEFTMQRSERPFASTEEMDQALIANWNQVVSPEDTVYIVGDLGRNSGAVPTHYLEQLNGHKHLIRGNYDTALDNQDDFFPYMETVTDYTEIDDNGHHIILCHYPILHFRKGYMIHGHLHNGKEEEWEILKNIPAVLNCGVDVNHYRPVALDELIYNNQIFYDSPEKGVQPPKKNNPNKRHWKPVFQPLPIKKR